METRKHWFIGKYAWHIRITSDTTYGKGISQEKRPTVEKNGKFNGRRYAGTIVKRLVSGGCRAAQSLCTAEIAVCNFSPSRCHPQGCHGAELMLKKSDQKSVKRNRLSISNTLLVNNYTTDLRKDREKVSGCGGRDVVVVGS